MREIPGTGFELKAELVLLAMGFVHPVHEGMVDEFGVELDARGNVLADTDNYATTQPKVFAAGDMRRGQSLVVWAIPRGPAMRPRRRRVPDGFVVIATMKTAWHHPRVDAALDRMWMLHCSLSRHRKRQRDPSGAS